MANLLHIEADYLEESMKKFATFFGVLLFVCVPTDAQNHPIQQEITKDEIKTLVTTQSEQLSIMGLNLSMTVKRAKHFSVDPRDLWVSETDPVYEALNDDRRNTRGRCRSPRVGCTFYESCSTGVGDYFLDSILSDLDSLVSLPVFSKSTSIPSHAVETIPIRHLL
jgi:hypothetical protein